MKQLLVALFAGALFGAGLAFSGMADPARVQGFLDLFGPWDPTLAFVMGGAMIPMALAWLVQRRIDRPFADAHFSLPGTSLIDRKLVIGAVLFGTGWGISGLCPGPGLADLAINPLPALAFVIALLAGMIVHRVTS
ncbi:DUF6691 family protein [Parasphingorhabdus sp.]|uniref:DUF6691 family protein n=1 Tax=Parasphingorhabdus sp. TaxID=2709688 RepID=UPI00300185CF